MVLQTDALQTVGIPKEGRNGIGVYTGLFIIQLPFHPNSGIIQLPGGVPVLVGIAVFHISLGIHPQAVIAGGIGDELVFSYLFFQLIFHTVIPPTQHTVLCHQSGDSIVRHVGLRFVENAVAVGSDVAAVIVGPAQGGALGGLDAAVGAHHGHVQTGVVAAHLILPIEHAELAKVLDVIRPVAVLDLHPPAADGGRIGVLRIFAGVHGQLGGAVFIQGHS